MHVSPVIWALGSRSGQVRYGVERVRKGRMEMGIRSRSLCRFDCFVRVLGSRVDGVGLLLSVYDLVFIPVEYFCRILWRSRRPPCFSSALPPPPLFLTHPHDEVVFRVDYN